MGSEPLNKETSLSYRFLFQINLHLKSHSQSNKAKKDVLTVMSLTPSPTACSFLAYVLCRVVHSSAGHRTDLMLVHKMHINLQHSILKSLYKYIV